MREPFDIKNRSHVKLLLITVSILVTLFISGILLKEKGDREEKELKAWYVNQLQYNFSTRIDTVIHLDQKWGYGEVFLTVNHKTLNLHPEDSLNATLKSQIRFLTKDYYKRIKFVIPGSRKYKNGDSVYIDSRTQKIFIYRNTTHISTVRISDALTDNRF